MNDASNHFLIDSNAIITPYLQYYPFDLMPKFWEQLEINIENGSICILDMVKNEILKGNDKLSEWIKGISISNLIDHRNANILDKYSEILDYIQNSGYYSSKALTEW